MAPTCKQHVFFAIGAIIGFNNSNYRFGAIKWDFVDFCHFFDKIRGKWTCVKVIRQIQSDPGLKWVQFRTEQHRSNGERESQSQKRCIPLESVLQSQYN